MISANRLFFLSLQFRDTIVTLALKRQRMAIKSLFHKTFTIALSIWNLKIHFLCKKKCLYYLFTHMHYSFHIQAIPFCIASIIIHWDKCLVETKTISFISLQLHSCMTHKCLCLLLFFLLKKKTKENMMMNLKQKLFMNKTFVLCFGVCKWKFWEKKPLFRSVLLFIRH